MNSTAFSMLDQGPGPGSYAIRDTFKKHKDSKGFKLAGRYEEPEKLNVPGPGSYKKVSTVLTNAKPMSFSKMERDNPMIVKDQVMTPPAGLYRIKGATSPNDKKGITICEKRPLKEQSERPHNPGPGTYVAKKENLKPMTGGYIGNSKRGGEPGPAVASATHKKKEASDDFEVERVIGDQRGPPGPGTYKPKPATVKGPKYSMAGKPQDEKPQQVPGPGTYKGDKFMNSVKSKATILIGPGPKSSKDITSRKDVPGPGSYKPFIEKIQGAAVIGAEERLPKDHSSALIVPGPGTYKVKNQITPIGAIMTQADRFKYQKSQVPGPGAYKIAGMFGYLDQK